jgi:hypothetical protein
MALSDLAVFNEQLFTTVTEMLDQQVELFNTASNGGIILASKPFAGDYSEQSFFALVTGLVRRRDPYGSGAVSGKSLRTLIETMVKVAAGTPPLEMDPGQFQWIKQNPDLAAAQWALMLAPQVMADMLGVAIGAVYAALSGQASTNVTDKTGATPDTLTYPHLIDGAALLGDRSSDIRCWAMHSTNWFQLIKSGIANSTSLFVYDTVKVMRDPLGTPFVVSDQPALITTGSPNVYHVLGLTSNGVVINTNNDYDQVTVEATGDENIKRTMQAEWSFNVGVKGFTWDKANGGNAPTNSSLFTATNWDKIATSYRDLAGVVIETN